MDLDHNPEQPIYHETGYHSTNSLIKNESANKNANNRTRTKHEPGQITKKKNRIG